MTRAEAARWLAGRDRFCILTHTHPDGDTVGSASALCLALRRLGKTAHLLENGETSPFLRRCGEGLTKSAPEEGDTIVSVDVASAGMLQREASELSGRVALRIDHHASATGFTPEELVDPGAAACADIIYDILLELRVPLDPEIAERLYIGVSTDTGCFRYANTNAHAYRVAAACAAAGAELYPITQALFDTNTLGKLRLQSWIVEHARFLDGGKAAVCVVPRALEDAVSREDMETIPGFLRSIEGVRISATIRQTPDGCKISVRAVPGCDAAAVCVRFGGGGHRGAAGANLPMTPEEAVEPVSEALEQALRGSGDPA